MNNNTSYRWALNSAGVLVPASVPKIEGEQYFCPLCRGEMIPAQGQILTWHYRHKNNACNLMTYLHKAATLLFYDRYVIGMQDSRRRLYLKAYKYCAQCKKTHNTIHRAGGQMQWVNLYRHYRTVLVERGINGFVADVLLPHDESPLLIEFAVTHKCEPEKIDSGLQIIEYRIEAPEDVEAILLDNEILEQADNITLYNWQKRIFTYDYQCPYQQPRKRTIIKSPCVPSYYRRA